MLGTEGFEPDEETSQCVPVQPAAPDQTEEKEEQSPLIMVEEESSQIRMTNNQPKIVIPQKVTIMVTTMAITRCNLNLAS
jgi:hypothetical protein